MSYVWLCELRLEIQPTKPPRLAQVLPRVVIISSVVLLAIVSARAARARATPRYETKLIFSLGRAPRGRAGTQLHTLRLSEGLVGRATPSSFPRPVELAVRPPSISGRGETAPEFAIAVKGSRRN